LDKETNYISRKQYTKIIAIMLDYKNKPLQQVYPPLGSSPPPKINIKKDTPELQTMGISRIQPGQMHIRISHPDRTTAGPNVCGH
jgi:hypothetical protein